MLNKWIVPVVMSVSVMMVACTSAPTHAEAAKKVEVEKAKGVWIDVRTPAEYQAGHLSGAANIPHEQIAQQIASLTSNKDEPIHLYCQSGRRAGLVLATLKQLGYTNVQNHGGYEDLRKQGLK